MLVKWQRGGGQSQDDCVSSGREADAN
jgi:hypothetical protein